MTTPHTPSPEERLAELLAACETPRDAAQAAPAVPDDLLPHWRQAQACLQLMEQLWPASAPGGDAASEHSDDGPATRPLAPKPAQIGPFRIVRKLGQGTFGSVYLTRDPLLNRAVALKVLHKEWLAHPELRERFQREARAIARLNHDHITPIYQMGEEQGVPFLAMPLLHGETLDSRLRREGRLPILEVVRLAREMAKGLVAAHACGLIHRDIKPSNIWLEAQSGEPGASVPPCRVKILDFGLARTVDDYKLTGPGTIVGTPAYMAPEQARSGATVDARSDLFSLGCVLYQMCTGELPFPIGQPPAAQTQPRPTTPTERDAAVPQPVSALVMQLLATRPEERPPSAQAVVAALDAIASPPAVPCPPKRAGVSRRRALAVAAAAPLLVGGIAVVAAQTIRRIWPQPEAQPPGPFVVVRANDARSEFQSLLDAVAELQDGDTIEVHGNGPFPIGHVELEGKKLTLRAGPGYRPQFVLAARLDEGDPWFSLQDSELVLEGCDFRCPEGRTTFWGNGGSWAFRQCRFFGPGGQAPFCHYSGSRLELADCLISVNNFIQLGGQAELLLSNNVVRILGDHCLSMEAPGGQTVRLRHNTLLLPGAVLSTPPVEKPEIITVDAEGNLFHGVQGDLPMLGGEKAHWTARYLWKGRRNLYVGRLPEPWSADGKDVPAGGLVAWTRLWGQEEGSQRENRVLYQWDDLSREVYQAIVRELRGVTARLRHHCGLANLGPDWELVGPGEPYVVALAEGKPVARKGLRPGVNPKEPFRLWNGVKPTSTDHATLQEAVNKAQSGDTIEILTDEPIGGVLFPAQRVLTVRAARGYRPVLRAFVRFVGNDRVSFEGIHFHKAGFSYSSIGCIGQLKNCSFEGEVPPQERALRLGHEGHTAKIVNCVIPDREVVLVSPCQKLEVRHSLVTTILLEPEEGKRQEVELTQSVVWNPCLGPGQLVASAPGGVVIAVLGNEENTAAAVFAEGTLFEVGGNPGHAALVSGSLAGWKGERNVYRIGQRRWVRDEPALDLAGWQRRWGSDAESVEAEPLDYDPRQWRLLRMSPGSREKADGKDFGADVSRVACPASAAP